MRSRSSAHQIPTTKQPTAAVVDIGSKKTFGGYQHKRLTGKHDVNKKKYFLLSMCFIILTIIMCISFVYQFAALRSEGGGGLSNNIKRPSHPMGIFHKNKILSVNKDTTTTTTTTDSNLRHQPLTSATNDAKSDLPPHLYPPLPILPIFPSIPSASSLIADTLSGHHPTITGIVALLQQFLSDLHRSNRELSQRDDKQTARDLAKDVIDAFIRLVRRHLTPFDETYRNRTIFDVRDDGSLFISLAAYREHLLGYTLRNAFREAKYPDRLFVGVVVQNCFGKVVEKEGEDGASEWIIETDGLPCKKGVQYVGKKSAIGDAPPDSNGIEEFCTDESFKKYCDAGQVRVIYVHETESMGPAMARYFASKLWGGETYFIQMDSHLRFTNEWDDKFIKELKATRNYPKSILSTYPPGFHQRGEEVVEWNGTRLCRCYTDYTEKIQIVRITNGRNYEGGEPRPTQIPFMAAGFFFTRAEFLKDVPYDPFLPWCFMGEELLLSTRSWTRGWNMYAPRRNLIKHEYRPLELGLPKYWVSVGQMFNHANMNDVLSSTFVTRIKHLIGYENVRNNVDGVIDKEVGGRDVVMVDLDYYGMGQNRTLEQYLEFAYMYPEGDEIKCKHNKWCNYGKLD